MSCTIFFEIAVFIRMKISNSSISILLLNSAFNAKEMKEMVIASEQNHLKCNKNKKKTKSNRANIRYQIDQIKRNEMALVL